MSRINDTYSPLDTRDWTRANHNNRHVNNVAMDDYNLKKLDNDWSNVLHSKLRGFDARDAGSLQGPPGSAARASFTDELDARGTFNKEEARKEFSRMHRTELEGRGLSVHKVGEILDRAEKRSKLTRKNFIPGIIHYKDFLEVLRDYRLSTEQETTLKSVTRVFAYVEEFSCTPPTLVMILLTLSELGFYLHTVLTTDRDITWTGPVPYCSPLIYNPHRRQEAWRFVTYMFIHIGIGHFVFNMIMQIIVGVSLEMEQSGWLGSLKVLVVYMSGVLAGSLGTSLSDSGTYLAGASGGCYALIAAHLATLVLNWQEDSNLRIKKVVRKPVTKIIRILFIVLLTVHDIGFAIYVRFYDPDNRTGFMGHLCGAIAGLTVGLYVLDNRNVKSWEPYVQIFALILYILGISFSIVWNVMGNEWSPGFFPDTDTMPIDDCR